MVKIAFKGHDFQATSYQCIYATCLCQKIPDSLSPLSPALRPGLVPMVLEELLSARAKAKKELKQAAASGGRGL